MASLRAAPAWIDLESELETDNETEGSTYMGSGQSTNDFLHFGNSETKEDAPETPKKAKKTSRLSSNESERSGASPRLGSTSPFTGVTRSHSYQRIPNVGVDEVDYSPVVLKNGAGGWDEGDSLSGGGGGAGPIDRSQNYYVDKKGRIKPLRWPYVPFVLLLTFCYTQDDIEVFLMYFLFAGTSYGCEFQQAFGIYLQINAVIQIFAQPVLAWVTDRFGRYSTVLLWGALLAEALIELLMVGIPGTSFGVMLTLCLLRAVAHIQNTDSIWKVFKQKLQFSLGDAAFSEQEDIINSIGMWGIVGEVVLDVYIFGSGFLLAGPGGFSYGVVSGWIFFCTVATSLLSWLVAYVWFTPGYVLEVLHDKVPTGSMPAYSNYDTVQDVEEPAEASAAQKLLKSRACHFGQVDFQEARKDSNSFATGFKGLLFYFKDALVYLFTDPIICGGLVHSLLVCLMWKLMANAEPVQLAQSNSDTSVTQTLDNLCGGTFTDLFYQYSWNNIFYVIGALLYILVLNRTKPYMYYMVVYPIAAVFFALCMIPLATGARYYFAVLMASVVGVFPWFLYRYDVYLVTAATDTKYLGILNAVIGYIRYITPAIPGIILAFDLTNLTLVLAYLSLGLSVLFCAAYVYGFRKLLKKISSPTYRKSSGLHDEDDTII